MTVINTANWPGRTTQHTVRNLQPRDTEETIMSQYRNEWSPEEDRSYELDPNNAQASLETSLQPRFDSARKTVVYQRSKPSTRTTCLCHHSHSDQIDYENGLFGCPWKVAHLDRKVSWFSFDWDVDVDQMELSGSQKNEYMKCMTQEDAKILRELKHFPTNVVRAKRRWITRQDVLQRLTRLTPKETQVS